MNLTLDSGQYCFFLGLLQDRISHFENGNSEKAAMFWSCAYLNLKCLLVIKNSIFIFKRVEWKEVKVLEDSEKVNIFRESPSTRHLVPKRKKDRGWSSRPAANERNLVPKRKKDRGWTSGQQQVSEMLCMYWQAVLREARLLGKSK